MTSPVRRFAGRRLALVAAVALLPLSAARAAEEARADAAPAADAGIVAPASDFQALVDSLTVARVRPAAETGTDRLIGPAADRPVRVKARVIDSGEAELVDGRAHIDLRPAFAERALVDGMHPVLVFAQALDSSSCRGLSISNRSRTGFDVSEVAGGRSATRFAWVAVAERVRAARTDPQQEAGIQAAPSDSAAGGAPADAAGTAAGERAR